ncbi:MAG: hypothetical protein A3H98_14770 [Bacteroidetes bacterium RIFCSPLOWO2_02_FULL_36_8]|nr:MAG: hypothetical protein A3H98_14770 [Bacteroidetes bacterium RIFCSPLOWO2_02_FULL_36_8]OFY70095.1 MAG: hypothetical protein A3G23_11690 [Bacteroidetes bacterium RIFCSPLOWO2_12_FULL_37_12]
MRKTSFFKNFFHILSKKIRISYFSGDYCDLYPYTSIPLYPIPMINLSDIIKNLNKEEIRHYKIFTTRIETQEERKDIKLFDLLKSGEYKDEDEALIQKIYPDGNRNAFYRLKGRLLREIEKSQLVLYDELDERIKIINSINLARIYTYKRAYRHALFLLIKAEKSSVEFKYYDLLDMIYNQMIEISDRIDSPDPAEIIRKREENDIHYQVVKESQYIISSLKHELKKTNFSSRKTNITEKLQHLLAELKVKEETYKLPEVRHQIFTCVSEILLQKQEFKTLEEFLLKSWSDFEKSNYFNISNHEQKITLLGWIINTLFKNKKFTESLHWTDILLTELESFNKLLFKKYIFIYHNGLVINYASLNRNKEAIALLEGLKEDPAYKGISFYDLFLYLNLATLYFSEQDLSKAVKNLSMILRKDKYDKLEPQIQMQITFIEVIIHFDLDNKEYIFNRIAEMKRSFRSLLTLEAYERELKFLKLLRDFLRFPEPFSNKKVRKGIEQFLSIPYKLEPGSNEGINYNAWLLSKINRNSYYSNLLKLMQS